MTIASIALGITVLGCMLAGFGFGKLHERLAWNALIENGTIPAPKRRRRAR